MISNWVGTAPYSHSPELKSKIKQRRRKDTLTLRNAKLNLRDVEMNVTDAYGSEKNHRNSKVHNALSPYKLRHILMLYHPI